MKSFSDVWRCTRQQERVRSPNGTAFTPQGDALWVVSSFDVPAEVWQVATDGALAGEVTEVASFESGNIPDGVAMGANGDLFIAQNAAGTVDRVTPDFRVSHVASGVDWAASLVFGSGDFDPCAAYATSLFGDALFEVQVGQTGG